MNINRTLLNDSYITTEDNWTIDIFNRYGCYREDIVNFLTKKQSFLKRQKNAISIIDGIMTEHGKKELLGCVTELARIEHGIQELEPWVRDHVVHALLSFILGIFIQEKFLKKSYDGLHLQWKIAGLFHDIGYPVQIAKDILVSYSTKVNEIKSRFGGATSPNSFFLIRPIGLEKLQMRQNSLRLMQNCINSWDLDIDVRREYLEMVKSGNICHGILSSLSVLSILDIMYQRYNPKREFKPIFEEGTYIDWNQKYFVNDIIPACAAIFVHNLNEKCFINSKIDRNKAHLPFLLKLCDSLQDWERPSRDQKFGFPASHYDIAIEENCLLFCVNIPDERAEKIQKEIYSCLLGSDIKVIKDDIPNKEYNKQTIN